MKIGQRWVDAIERSHSISEWVPFVVEIACGSRMKYALDKRSGQLELNRAMEDGVSYPTNYGFIPRTYSKADGIDDVDKKLKSRIEDFFKTYKTDEGEAVKLAGWFDRLTAIDKVKHALKAAKKRK